MLCKTFRAVATLQQGSFTLRNTRQLSLQTACFAGKHQWWEGGKLLIDISQGLPVRIIRDVLNWLFAPTIGRPTFGHYVLLQRLAGVIHDSAPLRPVIPVNWVI